MKAFKLVFLILSLFVLTFCSQKSGKQNHTSNGPKEQVVAFELPGMNDVIVKKDIPYLNISDSALKMDIYYPPNFDFKSKIPAIIFVFGYTDIAAKKLIGRQFRNYSWYISWCKIIAASGMAAIVYETVDPVNDLVSLAKYIQSNQDKLMIDKDNIGTYSCSANTPIAIANILNSSNNFFKCTVIYYGFFLTDDFEYLPQIDTLSKKMGFKTPRLTDPINWRKDVPILIVRAGLDKVPFINQTL